jgi:hypothetical protein
MLGQLDAMLAARNESFRTANVTVTSATGAVTADVQVPPSHAASDLLPELAGRIDLAELEGTWAITISLDRLGPDVRVRPLPASAVRRSFSARPDPALRRAG